MKLNEWKCDMDINDADIEPIGALKDMIDHFGLIYNPRTDSYDCDGDVHLYDYYYGLNATERITFNNAFVRNGKMTIRFGNVKGDFHLPGDEDDLYILTSLKGCPKTVDGDFICIYNQLTSLEGCPESVDGDFECGGNQLTLLEGCPEKVGGGFYCCYNQLTSLEGCPKSVGSGFDCSGNQLTSLEGCPESVGGGFWCSHNQLTSLECCPESVGGGFWCSHNQLTSLKGCPKSVEGSFYCNDNKTEFTGDDVLSVCDVKKRIYV